MVFTMAARRQFHASLLCRYSEVDYRNQQTDGTPNYGVSVLRPSGNNPIIEPYLPLKALCPTVSEILHLLQYCVEVRGEPAPNCVMIDHLDIIEQMQDTLQDCGVTVVYYAPPSDMESSQATQGPPPPPTPDPIGANVHPQDICVPNGQVRKCPTFMFDFLTYSHT